MRCHSALMTIIRALFPVSTVLLYMRKESDEVFDALMLTSPTLIALLEAVSTTTNIETQHLTISNIFQSYSSNEEISQLKLIN